MSNTYDADNDPQLRKIRALLAKAEGTDNEAERETFMAKVTDLITRWGIDEALLADDAVRSGDEVPTHTTIFVEAPYAVAKTVLVGGVASALGLRAIRLGQRKGEYVELVGFPGDLRRAEVLITSLFLQLSNSLHRTEIESADDLYWFDASKTRAWRRSFVISFSSRVAERLEEQAAVSRQEEAQVAHTGRSTDLVLLDRQAAVDKEFKAQHPHIKTSYIQSGSSASGRAAGKAAGDRAALGGQGLSGARAAIGA